MVIGGSFGKRRFSRIMSPCSLILEIGGREFWFLRDIASLSLIFSLFIFSPTPSWYRFRTIMELSRLKWRMPCSLWYEPSLITALQKDPSCSCLVLAMSYPWPPSTRPTPFTRAHSSTRVMNIPYVFAQIIPNPASFKGGRKGGRSSQGEPAWSHMHQLDYF